MDGEVVFQPVALDNEQLALTFYEAARAEVVQRLALREQTLLAWITTMGVVIGFAAGKPDSSGTVPFDPKLIRLVPLFCLPFALMVHRHNLIIRYIGTYVRSSLNPLLHQSQPKAPRHWDGSRELKDSMNRFQFLERLVFQVMEIAVPCGCIYYLVNYQHLSMGDVWIEAGMASIIAVFVIGVYDAIRS